MAILLLILLFLLGIKILLSELVLETDAGKQGKGGKVDPRREYKARDKEREREKTRNKRGGNRGDRTQNGSD